MLKTVRVSVARNMANVVSSQAGFRPQGYRRCPNTMVCVNFTQHCLGANLFHHTAKSVNTKRTVFVPDVVNNCFVPVAARQLNKASHFGFNLEIYKLRAQ